MADLATSKLKTVQSGLSSSKSKVDKLDIGQLETTPADLSKLGDVVKNDFPKKTEYYEFVKKVNNMKTTNKSDLVKKTYYNTKINVIQKKTTDHDNYKFINTHKHNFTARSKQANLASTK